MTVKVSSSPEVPAKSRKYNDKRSHTQESHRDALLSCVISVVLGSLALLRGCLKSSSCHEPTQHHGRHGEGYQGLTTLRELCNSLLTQCDGYSHASGPSTTHRRDRSTKPLPSAGRKVTRKLKRLGGATHCHQLPTRGPVDPNPAPLFTGLSKLSHEQQRSRRVRHRGGRDHYGQEEPAGSDVERPCVTCDLWDALVTTLPTQVRDLDGLAVATASRRGLVTPRLVAPRHAR